MKGKYIVFSRKGMEYAVLFPDEFVEHQEICSLNDTIVSAGYFKLIPHYNTAISADYFKFEVSGNSTSLGVSSRPKDAYLLAMTFCEF